MGKPATNYIIRGVRALLQREMSPRQADPIYTDALNRLGQLLLQHKGGDGKVPNWLQDHVLPALACYRAMEQVIPREQALDILDRAVQAQREKTHGLVKKLFLVPGMCRLSPWLVDELLTSPFREEYGYQLRHYETTGREFYIDVLACPYLEFFQKEGCPEVCAHFCKGHAAVYGGLHPKMDFQVKKTLSQGEDCCDFSLRVK